MSSSEERVVVLTFDNSNFEKNTQKSLETLNNLDASIEKAGAANGLTKLSAAANKIDLSGLANNVQSVSDRFSNMGVVGMTVIQNLTNSVVDLGKKAVHQMVSGGWTRAANIEKAKFQIEGLKGVWDETSKGYVEGMKTIKDAVNNAVDATAYGLDEAAVIGSQLMASGITDANQLEDHLKSVSGLAAMTGGSYADIGRIYAQVAGQGRLMGDQLLQISQRGINAAATMKDYANSHIEVRDALLAAAKASGKNTNMVNNMIDQVKKGAELTESDIRDLVSTGVVSFEFFSAAMGEAFSEHAKDANKTFNGALSNMKAALNRIGAEFATPLRNNLRDLFNAVTPVINNIKAALMPFINIVVAAGKKVTSGIVTVLNTIAKATAPVDAAAKTVKKVTKQIDKTGKTVKKLSGIMTISKCEAKTAFDIWNKGTYGNGLARRKALEKEGMSYKHVQGYVNALVKYNFDLDKVHKKIRVSGDKVSKTLGKTSKETKKATKHTKEYWHHLKILNENEKWRSVVQHKGVEAAWKLYKQNQKRIKQEQEEAHRLNIIRSTIIGVKTAIAAIKNVALAVWNVIKIIGASLKAVFGPILTTISLFIKAGAGSLAEGIITLTGRLRKLAEIGFSNVSSVMESKVRPAMTRFVLSVVSGIHKVKEFFETNKTLHRVIDSLGRIFTRIGTIIKNAFNTIKNYFTKTKDGKQYAKIIKSVAESLKEFAKAKIKQTVDQLERLSKMSWHLPDLKKAFDLGGEKKSSFISSALSKIKELKSGGISGILTSLFGIEEAHAATDTGSAIADNAKNLVGNIGKSSKLITNATDTLKNASETASGSLDFIKKTGGKLTEALSSFDWNKVAKGGWDVAKIYALIKGVQSAEKLAKGVTDLAASMSSVFSSVSFIANGIKENLGKTIALALIRDLAITVGILSASIYALSKIPAEDAYRSVAILAVVMGMLMGIANTAVKMSAKLGSVAIISITFVAMASSVLMLAYAMKSFANMKSTSIAKGLGIITLLITMFVLAGKAMRSIVIGGLSFAGMALAIDLLIPALILLSKINPATIMKGGIAIMYLMTELAIASRIARRSVKNAASMIAMAVAVNLLVPSIVILALLPFGKALTGAITVGVVLLSLAAAIKAASGMAKLSVWVTITTAIAILCGSLIVLALMPIDKVVAAATAITVVFGSLATALYMAQGFKSSKAGIVAMTLIVAEIGGIFYLLSQLPIENVISISASLSVALLSIAGSINLLTMVGAGGSASIKAALFGIAAFDMLIADLIGVLSALGALNKISGFQELLRGGSRIFKVIGEAIGGFVGSIVAGFGAAATSSLPVIGSQLSEFMSNLKPFIDGIKKIDPSISETIKNLAEAMMLLSGSSFLDAINIFGEDDKIKSFGEQMSPFVHSLKEFATEAETIDDSAIEAAEKVAKLIKTLASAASEIPNSGGVAGAFAGENDLNTFAEFLYEAAPNISAAANAFLDMDEGGIDTLKKIGPVIKTLGQAAQEIPNSGGFVGVFAGENDLNTFAEFLYEAAPNIVAAANAFTDIYDGGMERLAKIGPIIKLLAEGAKEIPNFNFTESVEDNKIGRFASYLAAAAPDISAAANALTTIEDGGLDNLKAIGPIIKSLAGAAQEVTSITGKFEDLGTRLKGLGSGVASFCQEIRIIPPLENVDQITSIMSSISSMAGVSKDFDPTSFDGLIGALSSGEGPSLGSAIASFCNAISGAAIDVEKLNAIPSIVDSIVESAGKATDVSYAGLLDLADNLPTIASKLKSFGANLKGFKSEIAKSGADVLVSLSKVVEVFQQFKTTTRKGSTTETAFDEKAFDSFGKSLSKLAKVVKDFAVDMADVDTEGLSGKAKDIRNFVNSTVKSVKNASTKLNSAGSSGIKNFLKGFNLKGASTESLSRLPGRISNAIGLYKFKTEGGKAGKKFVEGFEEVKGAKAAGETIRDKFIEGVGNLFDTGMQVGAGFVRGIESKGPSAYGAGAALFAEAKRAIKEKSDQDSPSKVTTKQGENVGEGLVVGMLNYRKLAYRAGEEVAGRMLSGVGDNLSSDFTDPVIKPVLDLSDVKSGANSIGGMFGTTSIRPSLVPMMRNRQNEATNDDLIEAINTMSSNIVQTTNSNRGETYNIGDVTLEVGDLKDVVTLEQLVSVIKKAKAFS